MLLALVLCLSPLQTVVVNATQENGGMLEEQNTNMESISGGQSEEVCTEEDSTDTVVDADGYRVTFSLNNYWQEYR